MDSPPKEETPNVKLPNDENILIDVDDDDGTSTIADLSVPSKDEEEEVKSNNALEHAIDILFKLSPLHPDGKASENGSNIKTWMIWNNVYQWDENSWDKGNPEFLMTNSIKNLHILWKYLHHLVREAQESSIPENLFSILLSDQFCNLTWKEFMTGDFKTPTRIPALYLILDIEGNLSRTPDKSPIRMPINSLPSRRESREKYHNTPSSEVF